MTIHLTESNFEEEVLKSSIPVMVDFFATWCGPCKMVGPVIEGVAQEYAGKLKVAKLDIDEASSLAMKYQVMSVPTILFFKDGEEADKLVGAVPKSEFDAKIAKLIGS